MKIPEILKGISNTLDITAALCDKSWIVFNDEGVKLLFIFESDGSLIVSRNGVVSKQKWTYIKANSSLLIEDGVQAFLLHPAFIDNVIFALQQDGTEHHLFMIDEKQKDVLPLSTLHSLKQYFIIKEEKIKAERELKLQIELKRQEEERIKQEENDRERIKNEQRALEFKRNIEMAKRDFNSLTKGLKRRENILLILCFAAGPLIAFSYTYFIELFSFDSVLLFLVLPVCIIAGGIWWLSKLLMDNSAEIEEISLGVKRKYGLDANINLND